MSEPVLDRKIQKRKISMDSVKLVRTCEMQGKAGKIVVNDNPQDRAFWEARGYKKLRELPMPTETQVIDTNMKVSVEEPSGPVDGGSVETDTE
jgi:hypothetical protein